MDYQGNSKKSKELEGKPKKNIQKVVTGEVVEKPKSIGRKFKDIFLSGDFRTAGRFVIMDIVFPSIRNVIYDAYVEGGRRVMYGDSSMDRRRHIDYRDRGRVSYGGSPIFREDQRDRVYTPTDVFSSPREKNNIQDILLKSRADAENVLEQLSEIISVYEVASVGDLKDLLGWPQSYVDQKWGWTSLRNVQIRQVREGFVLELPRPHDI